MIPHCNPVFFFNWSISGQLSPPWSPSRVRGWTFLLLNAAASPTNFFNLKKKSPPLWLQWQRCGVYDHHHECKWWRTSPLLTATTSPFVPFSSLSFYDFIISKRILITNTIMSANQSSFDRRHFSSRANFSHAAQHYWHVLPISTSSFLDLYFSFVYSWTILKCLLPRWICIFTTHI